MRYIIIAILACSFACAEDSKLPYEAQQAVDAMELQISKARRECLVKLDKCIGDITKTGNLEAAMVVKAKETEIQDAMPHVDFFGDQHGVVGKWMLTGKFPHEIKDGGVVTGIGVAGKWEISKNKLVITWNSGYVDTFNLPIKNNILNGTNSNSSSLTYTKIK